ncbi:uncharacterized protein LOC141938585, partial [Strix uralensis]
MTEKDVYQNPPLVKNLDSFYALLAKYGARPSPPGEEWARDNWANLQSVTDRVISIHNEARLRSGKGKAIICAVLGASLVAAIEDRSKRRSHEKQIIESLENLVQLLQKTISNLEDQLEKEEENRCLKDALREEFSKSAESLSEIEMMMEEVGVRQISQIYPQKELKEAKKRFRENPRVRPLIKAEYAYINDEDNDPHITTKEIPYTPTELAKMKREYGRLPKESETEYVWRVSLTGGDQIQLNEKEASGYWGHGVFLTTGDRRAPWSLTQRAAYWAGGLNPLDRGDPLAITGTIDQLLESVHKAACLQMIHERKLVPGCESPMMLSVNPEIMTPLIRGLPESLRSTGIDLQRTIASLDPVEKLESFINGRRDETNTGSDSPFNHSSTPSRSKHKKRWTWGDVAQELIDYSRKYGPVRTLEEKSKGIRQIGAKDLPLSVSKTATSSTDHAAVADYSHSKTGGGQPLTRQQWWALGIKKGVPRDIMDGLPLNKLSKLISRWYGPKQHPQHSPTNTETSPVTPTAPPVENTGDGKRSTEVMNVAPVRLMLPGEESTVTIYMVVGNIPTNLLGIDALKELEKIPKAKGVAVYQYIDDILVGGDKEEEVGMTQQNIISHLENLGLQIPPEKVQKPSQEDAEKRYTAWEKGLFVVSLALIEVEKITRQQPIVLRGPFKVIKAVSNGTPPPDGVAQRASQNEWEVNRIPVWQKDKWQEILSIASQGNFAVGWVASHQVDGGSAGEWNNKADELARLAPVQKDQITEDWERLLEWLHIKRKHTGAKDLYREALARARNQKNTEWPWTDAYFGHTGVMGKNPLGMNLATVIIYDNMTFRSDKWEMTNSIHTWTVERGKEIQIGCKIFNASDAKDPPPLTQITIKEISNGKMGSRIGQTH